MSTRVLFVLKRREDYGQDPSYSGSGVSTGLLNSATFMYYMLNDNGVEAEIVVVADNNCIDREVKRHNPTHVIIEALWVVPEKFEVLQRLHPNVKWIIRFHSEAPFIASEGIAMRWLLQYAKYDNVFLGVNAPRFMREVKDILHAAGICEEEIESKVMYMPNYYPLGRKHHVKSYPAGKEHFDIGCFGAIRPLKNHLVQAIAALHFGAEMNKKIHFHINVGRVEMKGDPILHNLQGLFAGLEHQGHKLVMHQWVGHSEFLDIIKHMDMGLQVSFSETFNIVAADMISHGVPVVLSTEIPWAVTGFADPTNSRNIAHLMRRMWQVREESTLENFSGLRAYCDKTREIWLDIFDTDM
jgi:hypothetical protein